MSKTLALYNDGTIEIYELDAQGSYLVASLVAPGLAPTELAHIASALIDLVDVATKRVRKQAPRSASSSKPKTLVRGECEMPEDPALRVPIARGRRLIDWDGRKVNATFARLLNAIRCHPEGLRGHEWREAAG